MYLFGQFAQRASIIKFAKKNMNVDFKLEIKASTGTVAEMHEIYSFAMPESGSWIYACGYRWDDPSAESSRTAATMKVSEDLEVQFLPLWGTQGADNKDVCRAVTFDEQKKEVAFMLEVTSSTLRPDYSRYQRYSSSNTDVLIITMRESGSITGGYNINMDTAAVSIGVGGHSLFHDGEGNFIFGAQSWGFKTKYQNQTYDLVSPTLDTHVFKYSPEGDNDCFFRSSFSGSEMKAARTASYSNAEIAERDSDRWLFKKINNLFLGYSSRYSGSFDLGDTLKYPKMCATSSVNFTEGVQYYRGQREYEYNIGEKTDSASVVASMDSGQTWLFQNGTAATGLLGRWDRFAKQGTIYVQTDSQEAEGVRRTILRGCSRFDDLLELYLYVNVKKNTYPDFQTEIETSWTLSVGERHEYKLPPLVDDEGNDTPEVYITEMPNQPYPPFMYYDNDTQTIIYTPHSIWYQGKTYYFIIVVKEQNSDSVMYPYYCTVKMSGVTVDPDEYLNYTDISFSMGELDRESKGTFKWSHPVNLEFVRDNWDQLFDVYIKNVTFREHNSTMPLLDFNITGLGDDGMTMYYQATFYEPYMLGLLIKKSDKLYIHMKYDLLDTKGYFKEDYKYFEGMVIGNSTLTRFFHDKCALDIEADASSPYGSTTNREKLFVSTRINMQFDFRNEQMWYMRQLSIKTYWYICGIVAVQFIVLMARNVGFLPVWTMIEYMQLVAFIPLYNFRLIPYLYDAFKPFLTSHLVLTNETFVLKEMQQDYFNINYDYYWLNVAKLGQALLLITVGFCLLVCINILMFLVWLCLPKHTA